MLDSEFSELYKNLIKPLYNDFQTFDNEFEKYFSNSNTLEEKNEIVLILKDFFANKGKRIRTALIFLITKALKKDIDEFCINIALATEFIHNATLIHDDIIDCACSRREKQTLNFEYDSKLAVLAGDYLLTEAMNTLSAINEQDKGEKIRKIYTDCLSSLIKGELKQYFNRFKLLTIEEYIEKSKAKTGKLFEASIVSTYLRNNEDECNNLKNIREFALNFGIMFQIKNDIDNLNKPQKISEDVVNGDYSAPIIYWATEKGLEQNILKNPQLIQKQLKHSNALNKTQELLNYYSNKAIENISFIEDNLYKQLIIDLCKLFTQ